MEERITPTEFRDYLMKKAKEMIENREKEEPDCMGQLPALLKTITDLTALLRDA